MKTLTTEEFIKKAKEIHGDKYDYSLVDYKNAKIKIKIICPKHGVFEQKPSAHTNIKQGCPFCAKQNRFSTTEEFIKRAKEVHGDKYDYSLVDYKNIRIKVKIICPKHGVFEQYPQDHLNGCGCPSCSERKKYTTEEFIKRAKEVHGDKYDYSLVDYINAHTKVKIICPKHGVFEQKPYAHLQGQGCGLCNKSIGEEKIETILKSNNFVLNKTYFREYCFSNLKDKGFLRYDFYIPSKNLLIEYNGIQHYKPFKYFGDRKKFLQLKHHDWLKRKYAKEHEIRLLTISYKDFKIIDEILKKEFY